MSNESKENKNRYFIISYTMSNGSGMIDMTTTHGAYINRKRTVELISDDERVLGTVIITNIIELCKTDYESWTYDSDNITLTGEDDNV